MSLFSLPLVLTLVVLILFFTALVYVIIRMVFKMSKSTSVAIGVTSATAIVVFLLWGVIIFTIVNAYNPCNLTPGPSFHYFHDHIKSLCVNREDKSECPRDSSQMEAFNPKRWQQLNQCAEVTYAFDENTDTFEFVVTTKNKMKMRASSDQNGGFTVDWAE